jgi:hypothetical protein
MQDLPSASELVEAVREFLERDIFPVVDGRAKYHTRVAMNVLGIVQRELEQSPVADPKERAGLEALLGGSAEAEAGTERELAQETLLDLNQALASKIREGTVPASREEIVAHLRETLRDKLEIANPRYLES